MSVGDFMKLRKEYTCPLELIQDMLKGKWKCIIIWRLRLGATSPSTLKRDISGITEKMLQEHLKELIDVKIIDKIVYDTYPLKTEYFLTDRGNEILKALTIFQQVGIDYMLELGQEEILKQKGLI